MIATLGWLLGECRLAGAQALSQDESGATRIDDEADGRAVETPVINEPEDIPPPPDYEPLRAEQPSQPAERPGELGVRVEDANGVIVRGVIVGAAGNKAGVRPGDRIVALDGQEIQTSAQVGRILGSKAAGETCTIEVLRQGETKTLTAVLEPYVGYYNNHPVANSDIGNSYLDPVRYRRGRYVPRYSYRPYLDGPQYRSYRFVPRYYGGYLGRPGFGYYGPGWGRGGLQLGPLNIWW